MDKTALVVAVVLIGTDIAALPAPQAKYGIQLQVPANVVLANNGTEQPVLLLVDREWSLLMDFARVKQAIISLMVFAQSSQLALQAKHGAASNVLQFNVLQEIFGMELFVPLHQILIAQRELILMAANVLQTSRIAHQAPHGPDLLVKHQEIALMAHILMAELALQFLNYAQLD
jgi:hypothetical protein